MCYITRLILALAVAGILVAPAFAFDIRSDPDSTEGKSGSTVTADAMERLGADLNNSRFNLPRLLSV